MYTSVIIVPAKEEHLEEVCKIAIEAWSEIHASYAELIGNELHDALFNDWEKSKTDSVKLGLMSGRGYVALVDGKVAGFISYTVNEEKCLGEILSNAVSKEYKGMGIGTKMYELVLSKIREEGMKYATVSTGLDDGHAPARRAYEKMGFKKNLPSVKYFMELE